MIVNFQDWASDEDVRDLLDKYNLDGVRASSLRKKYVVEVSATEKNLVELLSNEVLVKKVIM